MFMFIVQILVSIALSFLAYLLAPKPKQAKPEAAAEMENPTADAGRPIPVVFGTVTIKAPNFLWYGEKTVKEYTVKA